ncbi:MAG: response regulator [Bacteroidota bacterium]
MDRSKIIIFLVDDNALYLKDLEIAFSSKPYYNVITFATGELCLEKLYLKPDIIVLDYYLNSVKKDAINGLETLTKIRSVNLEIPVIILSTETNVEIVQNCLKHKANEFIIKDAVSLARLREIITTVFIDKQVKENTISHISKEITRTAL